MVGVPCDISMENRLCFDNTFIVGYEELKNYFCKWGIYKHILTTLEAVKSMTDRQIMNVKKTMWQSKT